MSRKSVLLLIGFNLVAGGGSVAHLSDKLDNATIKYATQTPQGSPFASVGRQVLILGPASLLDQLRDPGIEQQVPELIALLGSRDRDWAANLVLYSISGRDALPLAGIENGAEQWRASRKQSDVRYWERWWEQNRNHLLWDGSHLVPDAPPTRTP